MESKTDTTSTVLQFNLPENGLDDVLCIPVHYDAETGNCTVERSFTSAKNFVILDLLYNRSHMIDLNEVQKIFSSSVGIELSAVICDAIFPMAHKILNDKGIQVYKSCGTDLMDNLRHFSQGKLLLLDSYESSSSCGGVCSSCNTTCN